MGRVWFKIKPTGLITGIKLNPPGLAEAGMGVPNPAPITRRPGYDMWTPYVIVLDKP
jgi:hypothetical protein